MVNSSGIDDGPESSIMMLNVDNQVPQGAIDKCLEFGDIHEIKLIHLRHQPRATAGRERPFMVRMASGPSASRWGDACAEERGRKEVTQTSDGGSPHAGPLGVKFEQEG